MTRVWLVVAVCACSGESSKPPPPAQPPAPVRDSKVADAETAEQAAQRAAYEQGLRDHEAFVKEMNDPANRAPGWTKVLVGSNELDEYWGVYAGSDDVTVVGFDATIMQSRDGGSSWRRIAPGPLGYTPRGDHGPALIAEITGAGDHRYVIGFENDLVGVSTDRGETWQRVTMPGSAGNSDDEPTGLFAAGSDAYVSDRTHVYASHDGGATWKAIAPVVAADADDVREGIRGVAGAPDGRDVYAYGRSHDKPVLLASHDQGKTWATVANAPSLARYALLMSVAVAPDHTVYAQLGTPDTPDGGARDAQLATSHDGGASWTFQPVQYMGPPAEVDETSRWWSPGGWWIAPDGAIWTGISGRATMGVEVSTDHGKTWRHELSTEPHGVAFAKDAIYVVGYHNDLWIKRAAGSGSGRK